jgi:hypothetical protein
MERQKKKQKKSSSWIQSLPFKKVLYSSVYDDISKAALLKPSSNIPAMCN